MNKTSGATFLLLLGLPVLAFAAASEAGNDVNGMAAGSKVVRSRCVFPDSPREKAPAWVCAPKAADMALAAVGWHKNSKAGVQFTKDQAVAKARVELARAMTQQLGRKLNTYVTQRQISGGASAAKKVLTPAFEQQTRQTLTGSRIVQQTTNRKGTLYVLVGIDAQQANQATHDIVKGAIGHEAALWRPIKANQSAEEVATAIASLE
jgi:hypothetical protein